VGVDDERWPASETASETGSETAPVRAPQPDSETVPVTAPVTRSVADVDPADRGLSDNLLTAEVPKKPPLKWWICLAIGVASAVIGLLPWLIHGMRLPLQLFWGSPATPESMPIVLLPFSQYAVVLLFGLLLTGAAVAGIASRATRPWQQRAGQFWTILSLLAVQILAAVQTTLVVLDGAANRTFTWLYVVALVGVIVVSILVGVPVLLLIADAPRAGATIGLSIAALAATAWVAGLLHPVTVPPEPAPAVLVTVLQWLPAVLVGLALAWGGLNTAGRIIAAPVCLAILWAGPVVLAVIAVAAADPAIVDFPDQVSERARDSLIEGLASVDAISQPIIVALAVAAVGLVVKLLWRRGRTSRTAETRDAGGHASAGGTGEGEA
jgi:hypothetical protein